MKRSKTDILYLIYGPKRLQNHVHGKFTVRSRSRFKNERISVKFENKKDKYFLHHIIESGTSQYGRLMYALLKYATLF